MENLQNELKLELLEARLEMEAAPAADAPILPIECWCND